MCRAETDALKCEQMLTTRLLVDEQQGGKQSAQSANMMELEERKIGLSRKIVAGGSVKREVSEPSAAAALEPPKKPRNVVRCMRCEQFGHYANHCPNKPYKPEEVASAAYHPPSVSAFGVSGVMDEESC